MTKCKVEFFIHDLGGRYITYVPSVSEIKYGFWVDSDGIYTTGSNCKYFILPNMIKHIEKQLEE